MSRCVRRALIGSSAGISWKFLKAEGHLLKAKRANVVPRAVDAVEVVHGKRAADVHFPVRIFIPVFVLQDHALTRPTECNQRTARVQSEGNHNYGCTYR